MGGRLAHFKRAWGQSQRWQRSIVKIGVSWRWVSDPPLAKPNLIRGKPDLDPLVSDFLEKGVVKPFPHKSCFVSRIFTVPKSDGSKRLILDLKNLNKFLTAPKFSIPNHNTLRKILPQGAWLGKVDVQDAYLHLPIAKRLQKYLAFVHKNRVFTFVAMPFGLAIAPYVFTRVMKFPLRVLRSQGVQILAYLDDLIVWHTQKELCQLHLDRTIQTLKTLGFLINIKKSVLFPVRSVVWLGIQWSGDTPSMQLTKESSSSGQNCYAYWPTETPGQNRPRKSHGESSIRSSSAPLGQARKSRAEPYPPISSKRSVFQSKDKPTSSPQGPLLLGEGGESPSPTIMQGSSPISDSLVRCLRRGVRGNHINQQVTAGYMDSGRAEVPHQCEGTPSSGEGFREQPNKTRLLTSASDGQHSGHARHQEPRIQQIPSAAGDLQEIVRPTKVQGHHHHPDPCAGQTKRNSGCLVQTSPGGNRVANSETGFPDDMEVERPLSGEFLITRLSIFLCYKMLC